MGAHISRKCCCKSTEEETEIQIDPLDNTEIECQGAEWDYIQTPDDGHYSQVKLYKLKYYNKDNNFDRFNPETPPSTDSGGFSTYPLVIDRAITMPNISKKSNKLQIGKLASYIDTYSNLHRYSPSSNRGVISSLKPAKNKLLPRHFAYSEVAGRIYITGGCFHVKLKSCIMIDLNETSIMRKKSNMLIAKIWHKQLSMEAEDGVQYLFTIGGMGDSGPLSDCEIFRVKENIWRDLPSLPVNLHSVHACLLNNHAIYTFGGISGSKSCRQIMFLSLSWPVKWSTLLPNYCWNPLNIIDTVQLTNNKILIFNREKVTHLDSVVVEYFSMIFDAKEGNIVQGNNQGNGKVFAIGNNNERIMTYNFCRKSWNTINWRTPD